MNAINILTDLARRPVDALEWFWDRLDPAQLNAHPGGHDNSPAWLLWHAAREIDGQVADLAGHEPVWTARGFDARFGLDIDANDIGYGHTAEQARAITVPATEDGKALLRSHLEAVTEQAVSYLGDLTESDLAQIIDSNWDPPVTRGARLVSVFDDALQHIGQVAYAAGMPS